MDKHKCSLCGKESAQHEQPIELVLPRRASQWINLHLCDGCYAKQREHTQAATH